MTAPVAANAVTTVDYLFATGYPYELAGLLYYGFFLLMTRGKSAARFSQRSKVLTLVAAIALIGSVPLHYAAQPLGIAVMIALVAVAMWSTWIDRGRAKTPPAGKPQPPPRPAKKRA